VAFTIEDMRRFAGEAWGQFGINVVEQWCKFNAAYFDSTLRPVPLVITNTQPFGRLIAFCSYGGFGRTIPLNVPKKHDRLIADNCTLLHEMVHQSLFERGENPKHAGEPWRREIMRLTKVIKGVDIWAGKSTVRRVGGKATRMNAAHPETGQASLPQGVIARWPHNELGINFGKLGM